MPDATLTSKGQVTIPKEVREALHVDTGDRVQFFIREDGVVELRPRTIDLKDLFGVLEYEGKPVTVEAMNEAIGRAVTGSFKKSVGK
jgi:AbrB family looped-hinge helix DNA binding protein